MMGRTVMALILTAWPCVMMTDIQVLRLSVWATTHSVLPFPMISVKTTSFLSHRRNTAGTRLPDLQQSQPVEKWRMLVSPSDSRGNLEIFSSNLTYQVGPQIFCWEMGRVLGRIIIIVSGLGSSGNSFIFGIFWISSGLMTKFLISADTAGNSAVRPKKT